MVRQKGNLSRLAGDGGFRDPASQSQQRKTEVLESDRLEFQTILEKAHVVFPLSTDVNGRFELLKDLPVVARELSKELTPPLSSNQLKMSNRRDAEEREKLRRQDAKRAEDVKGKQATFVRGFRKFISDDEGLRLVVTPTKVELRDDEDGESNALIQREDSIARLLLTVEVIQPQIAEALFSRLKDVVAKSGVSSVQPEEIINHFRYLEFVTDSRIMRNLLFDMLDSSDGRVKEKLMECVPELITTEEEQQIAGEDLAELHMSSTWSMRIVLKAMANLKFSNFTFKKVLEKLKERNDDFTASDWVSILEFMIEYGKQSKENGSEMISELRLLLNLERVLILAPVAPERNGPAAEILHLFQQAFRFHKHISEAAKSFLQGFRNGAPVSKSAKVIDVVFLFLLHKENPGAKRESSIMKAKIKSEFLNAAILSKALKIPAVNTFFYDFIIEVAPQLIRSPEIIVAKFGMDLYKLCFLSFKKRDCEQRFELLHSVISHVGIGVESETEYAIGIIRDLAFSHPEELYDFTNFIATLLDCLHQLDYAHVKMLLESLAQLAIHCNEESDTTLEDLHRLTSKNLTSEAIKPKIIGLLAALMLVKTYWIKKGGRTSDENSQLNGLIEMLCKETRKNAYSRALLMEELAKILPMATQPAPDVVNKVYESIVEPLIPSFLEPAKYYSVVDMQVDPQLKLSDEEEDGGGGKVLAFAKLSTQNLLESPKSPLLILPFLQLCLVLRDRVDFDPTGTRLSLPVKGFYISENLPEQTKTAFCTSYFQASNWIRELLNENGAKAEVGSKDYGRVLEKLSHLSYCQKTLMGGLNQVENYMLPVADFNYDPENLPRVSRLPGPVTKGKKRKPLGDISALDNILDPDEPGPSTGKPLGGKKKVTFQPDQSAAFFRELDLGVVLNLLKAPLYLRELDGTGVEPGTHLEPDDLHLLLEDLDRKLAHALTTNVARRVPPWKMKTWTVEFRALDRLSRAEVFTSIVSALQAIRLKMDRCRDYFADIMAEDDNVMDGARMMLPESLVLEQCLTHAFSILRTLFKCREADQETDRCVRHLEIMRSFLERDSGESQLPISQLHEASEEKLLKNFYVYMMRISEMLPSFGSRVAIVEIFAAFPDKDFPTELQTFLAKLADECLKREWQNVRRSGQVFVANLKLLIETRLDYAQDNTKMEALILFVGKVIKQMSNSPENSNDPEELAEVYHLLDKNTWPHFFSVMWQKLVEYTQGILKTWDLDNLEFKERCAAAWAYSVRVFLSLLGALNKFPDLAVYGVKVAVLKFGVQYLKVAADKDCGLLTIIEFHYRNIKKTNVVEIIKVISKGTRIIQAICNNIKVEEQKKQNLLRLIPEFLSAKETWVRRTKAACILGGLEQAVKLYVKDLQSEEETEGSDDAGSKEDNENEEEEEMNVDPETNGTEQSDDLGDPESD